jgi:hypothetical protein
MIVKNCHTIKGQQWKPLTILEGSGKTVTDHSMGSAFGMPLLAPC